MIADLDTLLTALYVELTDRIIPVRGFTRCGPGGRPEVTDAELVCIAVALVLLRFDDERHWLRIAPRLIGYLLLGMQAAADLHLRRHRHRVQPGQPQVARRPGPGPADAGTAAGEPPRTRHRRRHR